MREFWKSERGAAASEYALALAIVGSGLALGATAFRNVTGAVVAQQVAVVSDVSMPTIASDEGGGSSGDGSSGGNGNGNGNGNGSPDPPPTDPPPTEPPSPDPGPTCVPKKNKPCP